eukprot:6807318-Pyramimonas_sp.AAC.1
MREKLVEEMGEAEFQEVCEDLKEITACMKRIRTQHLKRKRADLAGQIWNAYVEQRYSDMHKLRVIYQGNGRGPKRRYCYSPRTNWNAQTWEEELGKEAKEGGLAGVRIDCEAELSHYRYRCEQDYELVHPDADLHHLVKQDRRAMLRHCKRAAERRAYPSWGLPTEAVWLLLRPTVNLESPNKLSEMIERRMIRAAERTEEEEEMEKLTTEYTHR